MLPSIEFLGFHFFEWIALVSSGLYTYLAAKGNIWCWIFGLIGAFFTLLLCIQVLLYSEAVLQVFYIIMSIYGWIVWSRMKPSQSSSPYMGMLRMSFIQHIFVIVIGLIVAVGLGLSWGLLGAEMPYIDGLTTSFSIIATFLIARKFLENWLYWIAIDLIGIYLYYSRGLYLLSVLFVVYTLLAIYGYYRWRIWYEQKHAV